MEDKMSIQYYSSLDRLKSLNDSFDSAILRIAHHGKNRNKSHIPKHAFESAIPSMFNCPVVTHYMHEKKDISGEQGDMGGHDGHIEMDNKDNVRYVVETTPIGVIPESAKYWWETIDDNGELHEYLCTEVLLWKRQEAYNKLKTVKHFSHSMEININAGDYADDGYFNITDFNFEAFTILGSDVTPCFPSSAIELYGLDKFKEEFSLMLSELKQSFAEGGEQMENQNENIESVVEVVEEQPVEQVVDEPVVEVVEEIATEVETPVVEEPTTEPVVDFTQIIAQKDDLIFNLNTQITSLNAQFTALQTEVEELREYKRVNEAEKTREEKEQIFQDFSIGLSTEDMQSVKEQMDNLSVIDIKSKLNEIFTQKNLALLKKEKFSAKEVVEIVTDVPKKEGAKSKYAV